MANRTYEFDIIAKIDQAIRSVDSFADGAQKRLDGINFRTGISAIKDGFDLVRDAAEVAFGAIEGFASKAIAEALEAEEANVQLANALRITGDFSEQAVTDFDNLGKEIQNTTKFTADAVKTSAALAKQFRLTNAEVQKAIPVAADLAAITGTTLEDATRKVAQTMNGFVDKSLAKAIPGLKNLSKEALIAGEGLELIERRVAGSAEALGNTFSGAIFRVKENVNDIFETFGNFIIQNPAIVAGLNEIAKGLSEMNGEIEKSGDSFRSLITSGFLAIVETAPSILTTIQRITQNMTFLALQVDKAGKILGAFAAALVTPDTAGQMSIGEALREDLEQLDIQFGASLNKQEEFFAPLIAKTREVVGRVKDAVTNVKNLNKEVKSLPSTTGISARLADAFNPDEIKKKIADIAKEPIKFAFEAVVKGQAISKEQGIAIGAGLVANILKGAAGARKLLQEGFAAAADTLIPGIGGAVGEIVGVLSQGPEETRKMVTEFVRAIPELIKNLAESIPVLIEVLVTELPPALAKTMPTVAVGFSTALIANIPKIVEGFAKGLVQAAKDFVQAIIDQVKTVGGLFGGEGPLGGVGDFFGDIGEGFGDIFGFASGGKVPDVPQFSNDRLVARISGGERVLDRETNEKFEELVDRLNENGGVGNTSFQGVVQLQLGFDTFAKLSYEADRRGFRLRAT